MKVRTLEPIELELAAGLLFQVGERAATQHGYSPPWPDERAAHNALVRYRASDTDAVIVAEEGGAVIGVGAARLRGEVASIGPIATYMDGRGLGGAILDELLNRVDSAGAQASRLGIPAWNTSAYALCAGRGFAVVDMASHVERQPEPPPALDSARGLEVRPFERRDLDALVRFDARLTGHERGSDLAERVRLVARRRGEIVGYLGACDAEYATILGPAIAVDASDLVTLIATALTAAHSESEDWIAGGKPQRAVLSTAALATSMAAMGIGFRVKQLDVVMSRGAPRPARPPQLYSALPEIW
ncbi:MAG: GNAT family N-acetyltransferase [Myxococcota bacterium]